METKELRTKNQGRYFINGTIAGMFIFFIAVLALIISKALSWQGPKIDAVTDVLTKAFYWWDVNEWYLGIAVIFVLAVLLIARGGKNGRENS